MKTLFFFLFLTLLPPVNALAVTPTSIDITDGTTAKLYVYNTQNSSMNFEVYGMHKENFSLAPYEKKRLDIFIQAEYPGYYKGEIIIGEVYEDEFFNAIEIPIYYSGSFSRKEPEKYWVWSSLASAGVLCFLILGIYGWKRKKKNPPKV